MIESFDKLELDTALIQGLKKQGITIPTDIQKNVIPYSLQNKDIIGESQTGSGKTLAYLLPIFQRIDNTKREMQALILAPTHELAMQINAQIKLLAENSNMPITSTPIIAQVNILRQIEKLKEKPHIIVGSAGRVLELIKKRKITAHTLKTIVIDEGDRMLDENNLPAVKDIIKTAMRDTQLMLFSATISTKTLHTAKDIMKDPITIKVKEDQAVNPNIDHIFFVSEQRDKIVLLRKLVASINPEKAIVFINKSDQIQITTSKLQYHKLKAYGIHGSSKKQDRQKALESFRKGDVNLLIASDLAARGLDIQGVTHIFNLDLPEYSREYLHRVGRTGRVDQPGTAISIVTEKELSFIRKYEKELNIKIQKKKLFKGNILDPKKNF